MTDAEVTFLDNQRKSVMFTMSYILGTHVDVAIASDSLFGQTFQIMCDGDFEYFNWYCINHEYGQFHRTPILAAINYLKFREQWYKERVENRYREAAEDE